MKLSDHPINQRKNSLFIILSCLVSLLVLLVMNLLVPRSALVSNLYQNFLPPSAHHLLGTDALGRDMVARIIKGLGKSFLIGTGSALLSVIIATFLGIASALFGKTLDRLVTGLIDMVLALPHLVLLILISFVLGGGPGGVISAVALTHWPALTRVVRAEIIQFNQEEFIQISRYLGRKSSWIALHHILPHLLAQIAVGFVLLFPHAILHSAGLAFLGFGLDPATPSLGILLRESMLHLSTGYWWLAVFPGLTLVILVLLFDTIGRNLKRTFDPRTAQE